MMDLKILISRGESVTALVTMGGYQTGYYN